MMSTTECLTSAPIRSFEFRIDADTSALREAVENSVNTLRAEFPAFQFNVIFGGGG